MVDCLPHVVRIPAQGAWPRSLLLITASVWECGDPCAHFLDEEARAGPSHRLIPSHISFPAQHGALAGLEARGAFRGPRVEDGVRIRLPNQAEITPTLSVSSAEYQTSIKEKLPLIVGSSAAGLVFLIAVVVIAIVCNRWVVASGPGLQP